jgi:hypothetical protein
MRFAKSGRFQRARIEAQNTMRRQAGQDKEQKQKRPNP